MIPDVSGLATKKVAGNNEVGLMLRLPGDTNSTNRRPQQQLVQNGIFPAWNVGNLFTNFQNGRREQNNIQYDIVVRYRTDCLIKKPMFNDIPSLNSYLVIPRSSAIKYVDVGNNDEESICDLLAYGTRDRMDIYTDTFLTWLPIPETPIGEICLAKQLIQNNVRPLRPFIHFYLVEGNGEVRGEIVDPQEN
jgi:hypothetical protein